MKSEISQKTGLSYRFWPWSDLKRKTRKQVKAIESKIEWARASNSLPQKNQQNAD
jgi:hypothetical protein